MNLKGFKYRIYPSKSQKEFLENHFGSSRFIYNHFLSKRISTYNSNKLSKNKEKISYNQDAKLLTELKNEDGYSWLNKINSQSLQSSLKNLDTSYKNFFKNKKGFPKFHKKSSDQSFKIPQFFKVKKSNLFIPKLKKGISIRLHRDMPKKQISCHISKNSANQYFASFLCEVEILPKEFVGKVVGIDLGIKNLVVTSNNLIFENKNFSKKIKRTQKCLVYEQRKLSNKQKGSKNREKQRLILAKIHLYLSNSRKDYLHKISHQLINENQVIITEDLAVKNLLKNHKLAKAISEVGWGELVRQLDYKAKWYQRTFHKISRYFASSKTCNVCKFKKESLSLSEREWECLNCHVKHDRDLNAALNIRDKGIEDLLILSSKENVKSVSGLDSDYKEKLPEALASKVSLRKQKQLALN